MIQIEPWHLLVFIAVNAGIYCLGYWNAIADEAFVEYHTSPWRQQHLQSLAKQDQLQSALNAAQARIENLQAVADAAERGEV